MRGSLSGAAAGRVLHDKTQPAAYDRAAAQPGRKLVETGSGACKLVLSEGLSDALGSFAQEIMQICGTRIKGFTHMVRYEFRVANAYTTRQLRSSGTGLQLRDQAADAGQRLCQRSRANRCPHSGWKAGRAGLGRTGIPQRASVRAGKCESRGMQQASPVRWAQGSKRVLRRFWTGFWRGKRVRARLTGCRTVNRFCRMSYRL
jgi:hypothetical protein